MLLILLIVLLKINFTLGTDLYDIEDISDAGQIKLKVWKEHHFWTASNKTFYKV